MPLFPNVKIAFKILITLGLLESCSNAAPSDLKLKVSRINAICQESQLLTIEKNKDGYFFSVKYDQKSEASMFFAGIKRPINLAKNVQFIQLPVKRIILLASSHIGMLKELKKEKLLSGISGKQYLCLNGAFFNSLPEFSDFNATGLESVLATNSSFVMYSGFDSKPVLIEKLESSNLPCIPNYDWREESPLARAEWIKLFGILTGQENEATAIFDKVSTAYSSLKKSIGNIQSKPTVFAGSMIGDVWYSPGGSSYLAEILKDAGADYVYKNEKVSASLSLTFEKAFETNINTQFWLNDGAESLSELAKINSRYAKFGSFTKKLVFGNKANSNCFWEQSAARPDLVLKDLIQIFHPELKTQENSFYQQLK